MSRELCLHFIIIPTAETIDIHTKIDGPSLFYRGNVIPVAKSGTENKNDTQINGYMLMK